jgi:transcriptional regulator with XRE-family HTH domain
MASEVTIPHAVVSLMVEHEMSPARAWREYMKLTQEDVAAKLNMTPAEYALLEDAVELPTGLLGPVAGALGILAEQLDV